MTEQSNIQFKETIYYYVAGDSIFTSKAYDDFPWLFWGDHTGLTEMTRKEFTSLIINGDIIRICEV